MKKIILLCLFVLPLIAVSQEIDKSSYVETSAVVSKDVTPDIIRVKVMLSESKNLSLETLENAFSQSLKMADIDVKEDVVVSDQSSRSAKRNNSYRFKSYIVTFHSADNVDEFFCILEENQIPNASVIETSYSKKDELLQELLTEATKITKQNAESMAKAISQSIGPAIYLYNTSMYNTSNNESRVLGYANKAAGMDTAVVREKVEFKKITYTQHVTAKYKLYNNE